MFSSHSTGIAKWIIQDRIITLKHGSIKARHLKSLFGLGAWCRTCLTHIKPLGSNQTSVTFVSMATSVWRMTQTIVAPFSCRTGQGTVATLPFFSVWESVFTLLFFFLFFSFLKELYRTNGQRSVPFQAATVWNNLPQAVIHSTSISSFKSSLKTHLFSK